MPETRETYNLNLAIQALTEEGVVALKFSNPRQEGEYESWICIHTIPHNEFHPYVVHRLVLIDDHADRVPYHSYQGGEYCATLNEALERFNARR